MPFNTHLFLWSVQFSQSILSEILKSIFSELYFFEYTGFSISSSSLIFFACLLQESEAKIKRAIDDAAAISERIETLDADVVISE